MLLFVTKVLSLLKRNRITHLLSYSTDSANILSVAPAVFSFRAEVWVACRAADISAKSF